MTAQAPRGWLRDDALRAELAALYAARTGQRLEAEAWLSPRMAGRTAGVFQPGPPPRIALSQAYLSRCSPLEREDLMLHELAHYHLWRLGLPRAGHGAPFRALMRAWQFSRYPSAEILRGLRPKDSSPRLLYVCPAGHEHWLRRPPKAREVSCGRCCRTFDRRFLLRDTGIRSVTTQERPAKSRS
jgi:predicted SprT family Zn-dependent metalloprotease